MCSTSFSLLFCFIYWDLLSPVREVLPLGNADNSNSDPVLRWLASPIWVTPRQGRWGRGGPPRWQGRHGPHERRVVGAFSGARAACGALYCGPLVCRAGSAVILMSIHGSMVPTEVVEEIGRHWVGGPAWQGQYAGRDDSMEVKRRLWQSQTASVVHVGPHMQGFNRHTCVFFPPHVFSSIY